MCEKCMDVIEYSDQAIEELMSITDHLEDILCARAETSARMAGRKEILPSDLEEAFQSMTQS